MTEPKAAPPLLDAKFARKVRAAALNKDADISVTGSWTIQF